MIELLEGAAEIILLLAGSLILARAVRGPTVFDRVIAIETLALGIVGLLLLQAKSTGARLYLDAALAVALFSFVGAVVVAYCSGCEELDDR